MLKLLTFALILLQSIHSYAGSKTVETINLTAKNTVFLHGQIDWFLVDNVLFSLVAKRAISSTDEPVYLILDTQGGYVESSAFLVRQAQTIKNLIVFCKFCASAGAYMFETVSPSRLVNKDSYMLMHHSFITVNSTTTQTQLLAFLTRSDAFDSIFYTKMNISKSAYEEKIKDKEFILEGTAIITNKLADKQVNITCDEYITNLDPALCGSK